MHNIAIVLISSGMGGGENSVLKLIKSIDRTRFNIFLIINKEHKKNYEDHVKKENIFTIGSFYPSFENKFLSFCVKVLQRICDWRRLLIHLKRKDIEKFIYEKNIHLLHAQLSYDLYLSSLLVTNVEALKSVYTVRGYINFDTSLNVHYGVNKKLLLKALRDMNYVTCVSNSLLMFMRKTYNFINEDNSMFIPNGLLKEEFQFVEPIKEKDNVIRIIYMGGEKSVKGGDLLNTVMELLKEKYKLNNFKLIVLGPLNNCKTFYGKRENKNLEIIGFVQSPKHLQIMKSSDIIIMPSRSEGFANVALEAMALGLPIVASNIRSFQEVIKDGVNGILCELNAESFAEALEELIVNKELRCAMSKSNKNFSMYWWENIVTGYESMYMKVIKG